MPSQTAKVTVYRTRYCPFCVAAARLLDQLDVLYEEVDLDGEPDRRAITNAILPGHRTVPLVVIDERPIGGYEELSALHGEGQLEAMLFAERS